MRRIYSRTSLIRWAHTCRVCLSWDRPEAVRRKLGEAEQAPEEERLLQDLDYRQGSTSVVYGGRCRPRSPPGKRSLLSEYGREKGEEAED